jgi:membrane protein DedA with SNARE-associated domain
MLELIESYGYFAVFVGAFFEGETVMIIAGFLATTGHLELAGVFLAGIAGGVAGDQFYFYLGRARGRPLLERRPSWRPRMMRIESILARHGTLLMLGYRFMYGLRVITPVVLGAFGVERLRFLLLNVINASVWSAVVTGLGYAFGEVMAQMFKHVQRYEMALVAVLALAGVCVWLVLRARERRRAPPVETPSPEG